MRIGMGYDSHRFEEGRPLVIGGVEIPHKKGLSGHSDADVLVHAIIDGIIGAMGTGDIGRYFPDTDPAYRDASSLELLKYVLEEMKGLGLRIEWVDATVIAEAPRIGPYIQEMIEVLQRSGLPEGKVNIKAKTNEGMGFVGRDEGIASIAVVLLTE
jgi:2-C-methyl-D-erythritol 2,4-cyclodiphosphate synthase